MRAKGPAVNAMTAPDKVPVVFIVDDDLSAREGLQGLVESMGLRAKAFESAEEFLSSKLPDVESCLVLDIRLRGKNGLEFQEHLIRADIRVPVIFMSGFGDVPMTVRAMKAGAIDFLPKPFGEQEMLDAIFNAITRDRQRRQQETQATGVRVLYASLSLREQEVLALATSGLLNKQIAAETGVSESTIKAHRANMMRKMQATSFADLVRKVELLGLNRPSGKG
jgi:FixJ family two-component response regulator